jgi:very-short-patch-repair endonuclease
VENYYHYNKNLKQFARKLRNNSTKAEILLWKNLLRAKNFHGFAFLRQRPVGNYIADFMCKELKLIIEVDGFSHQFSYEKDSKKDTELNALGFQVLRISDEEVIYDLENVIFRLEGFIKEQGYNLE